ncbi:hypothetical protein BDN71DRAFT_1438635 [Pleurotus eryngii]|uniref:Uncharacterized protein n=1 Tax=Pleurotus eryngii TaxID=5323 RepID=A0A9P6AB59_PLEER|nr:hypothetical protein BDN71DRAFT_1438635 [Pleurotus eryngii]
MPPTCDTYSDISSDLSSISECSASRPPPVSPTKARQRPESLRLHSIGDNPSEITGKLLKSVRRSSKHPAITMEFSDHTTYQVLVDGYDPQYPGVPKELEMDELFYELLELPNGKLPEPLAIIDCVLVTLTDKAFERKHINDCWEAKESRWDQNHLGLAFKLAEDTPRWRCVWATMSDYDPASGSAIFRSYDDVYLKKLQRSSRTDARHRRKPSWARP